MAGINNRLVEDYRDVISRLILQNDVIVDVLCDGTDKTRDTLLWTHVMPQRFVSQTITEAGAHIFYDIDETALYDEERNQPNLGGYYENVSITFWVLSHKGSMFYKSRLKHDVLSEELIRIFHNNKSFGIAPAKFMSNTSFVPDNREYTARQIIFNVTDFGTEIRQKAAKIR